MFLLLYFIFRCVAAYRAVIVAMRCVIVSTNHYLPTYLSIYLSIYHHCLYRQCQYVYLNRCFPKQHTTPNYLSLPHCLTAAVPLVRYLGQWMAAYRTTVSSAHTNQLPLPGLWSTAVRVNHL